VGREVYRGDTPVGRVLGGKTTPSSNKVGWGCLTPDQCDDISQIKKLNTLSEPVPLKL